MDFVNIGKECFADKNLEVISYKGENYYRACGVIVKTTRYGTTSCVKRVNHPGNVHEDYAGLLKEDSNG